MHRCRVAQEVFRQGEPAIDQPTDQEDKGRAAEAHGHQKEPVDCKDESYKLEGSHFRLGSY